jgi:hypothetical protein
MQSMSERNTNHTASAASVFVAVVNRSEFCNISMVPISVRF